MMSIHRLSAGSGYQYLLRNTASGDVPREPGQSLVDYYAGSKNPAGQWIGRGLAALGANGTGLLGSVVTEEQMRRLFGEGRHPLTSEPIGRPYPVFAPLAVRVERRVKQLPGTMSPDDRERAIVQIKAGEESRTQPAAVAGFDLTFTAAKSVSVLWGLGDPKIHRAVLDAHDAAVADVLVVVEDRALFTRTGHGGCAQIKVTGMLAAAFKHWDSRAGDPNLHTHVVVANKVSDANGVWRSLDSKALFHATVFASELYEDLLADHLSARLPVRWGWRDRGPRRSPAYEIDGIDDRVLAAFSTRSADVDAEVQRAVTDFHLQHSRRPSRTEVIRLRQTATLKTRPAKTAHALGDLIRRWAEVARRVTGADPQTLVDAALAGHRTRRLRADWVGDATTERMAELALADVMERRSTWTSWNVGSSAARVTLGLRMMSTTDRLALVDRVADLALAASTRLEPADPVQLRSPELHRSDGSSVFTRHGETRYSHTALLDAEDRLLQAHAGTGAPSVPEPLVDRVLSAAAARRGGRRLTVDQADAVRALAASTRQLDVLVGPAGTGKTATLAALRVAWEAAHGHASVLGLAPSATAAHELGAALDLPCENVTKWLIESDADTSAERHAVLAAIPHRRAQARQRGDTGEVRRLDQLGVRITTDLRRWALRPGQLLIVDEASLAGTLDLDRLRKQTSLAGAKLLLVGDHHQLSAVDAGGAFRLLARTGHPSELRLLWRFRNRWEADASRKLRDGDSTVIADYTARGRVHDGPAESMLEAAYTAWSADQAAGHTVLLIAADTNTVTALNQRVHDDRVDTGAVTGPTIALGGDCAPERGRVGVGDRILTRRNDRALRTPTGRHVRNGALWTVTAANDDGSLDVTPARPSDDEHGGTMRLPPSYVAEHVDLGYAVTVHRAQGVTVDRSHVIATPAMIRETLYVAMTRGREANTVYVTTDATGADCDHPDLSAPAQTADGILTQILCTSGAELSATETMAKAAERMRSVRRLGPIRDTITAAVDRRRMPQLLREAGLSTEQANAVDSSPASGPLYAALRRAEHLGHHPGRLVTTLIGDAAADDAGDIASVLHHRVDARLATAPDHDHRTEISTEQTRVAAPNSVTDDDLDDDLATVEALIHRRARELADRAGQTQKSWQPPRTAPDKVDRHHLAIDIGALRQPSSVQTHHPARIAPDHSQSVNTDTSRRIA